MTSSARDSFLTIDIAKRKTRCSYRSNRRSNASEWRCSRSRRWTIEKGLDLAPLEGDIRQAAIGARTTLLLAGLIWIGMGGGIFVVLTAILGDPSNIARGYALPPQGMQWVGIPLVAIGVSHLVVYGSPGADLDVRLTGPLQVHLAGSEYDVARFPEDRMLLDARTGIVARVQAQTPTVFEVRCDGVDVRVTVVDSAAHLRVDAIGRGGEALVTRETNVEARRDERARR